MKAKSVEDVIKKIPYQQIEDLLDEEKLVNADELEFLGKGLREWRGRNCYDLFFNR